MDWTRIIDIAVTAILTGSATWILFFRQSKSSATSDAISKSSEAMEKLLDIINQQQEVNNSITKQKDAVIEQQEALISEYKNALDETNHKNRKLEYILKENTRKITGMQKIIDNEMAGRRVAEQDICFVQSCTIRKPERGTYRGGKAKLNDIKNDENKQQLSDE